MATLAVALALCFAGAVLADDEADEAEQLQSEIFQRESNAVEVLVGRVRRKIGPGITLTRRGFGYTIQGAGA